MSGDRVEITWDDLPEEPPARAPIPPAAPAPGPTSPLIPPSAGRSGGAPSTPGSPLRPGAASGWGGSTLPPMPTNAPRAFSYAAPNAVRNNRPLIIGGVIVALVLAAIVVNLARPEEGGSLSRGSSESGSVGIDDEVNYRIDGQGSSVHISVTGENGFDPTVAVEDSSGNTVGYNDDSGGGYDSYHDVYLESGRSYSVVVEGFSGDTGDYRIYVS